MPGDEFLRSLNCNNNSYNVDSAGNWLDWNQTTEQAHFRAFASRMIGFRLQQPALRPDSFYAGLDGDGNRMAPLDWFGADKSHRTGSPDAGFWQATPAQPDANGHNRTLAWRYDGAELGGGDTILVLFNGEPIDREFTLPWTGPARSTWCRVTDTAAWAEGARPVRRHSACVRGWRECALRRCRALAGGVRRTMNARSFQRSRR
jgi:isoamylase